MAFGAQSDFLGEFTDLDAAKAAVVAASMIGDETSRVEPLLS